MDHHKLEGLPLFSGLGKKEMQQVGSFADEVDVSEGKTLLHQGDFAHEFMVVLEGRAEVVRDSESVAELGPGDFLGEVAALDHGQRNATVVARSPMRVAVMTDRDMRHIAREMPDVDAQLREAAREHCPL
jgi:CRP/FNR family transcriptional regulator, cyclic AMP receptor protein